MCICIGLSLVAGGWYFFQAQKLTQLENDVTRLKSTVSANGQIQGNIVFFVNKKEQLKTYLEDDANFEYYFKLLTEAIEKSGTGAVLVSFSLNQARDSNFIIGFSNFQDSKKLLDYIETEAYLANFEKLILSRFAINQGLGGTQTNSSFQLTFSSKFKEQPKEEASEE